jgi:hypothetical protein
MFYLALNYISKNSCFSFLCFIFVASGQLILITFILDTLNFVENYKDEQRIEINAYDTLVVSTRN